MLSFSSRSGSPSSPEMLVREAGAAALSDQGTGAFWQRLARPDMLICACCCLAMFTQPPSVAVVLVLTVVLLNWSSDGHAVVLLVVDVFLSFCAKLI